MKKSLLVTVLVSTVLASNLSAKWGQLEDSQNISVGAQLGGLAGVGIGAQLKYKIDSKFGVRAGFETISVNDVEIEDEEVKYNFDATVQDLNLLIDWHPWEGSFRTTAGLLINNSDLDGDLTPAVANGQNIEFEFEGKKYKYAANELGSIHTTADFDPVAPYVGIGWDTSFNKDKGFGFTFDVGVAFTGSMKADYSLKYGEALDVDKATANLTGATKEQATKEILAKQKEIKDELGKELDKEMITLQDELDQYDILPYISIGFNCKF
jgi:cold shock CspA family protein